MRRLVFVFAALLTGAAVRAHAQPSGVLAGTVHTSEGTPVPNLVLVVQGPDAARTVVTGPEGRYRVTGVTPGHYRLALRAAGFLFAGSPEADVSAAVTLDFPETGGHVGFVSGRFPGNLDWLPRRIVRFFGAR